jgi:uroporphyrin-III C-methyltransferase
MSRAAKVYLVGAGPGDPDLLTRKAIRVLEQADVVIHDRLVSAEVLALAKPDAIFVYAGKWHGQQQEIQAEIYANILHYVNKVDTIVRLKSGDPLIFGRGGEELEFLAQHCIESEVVPGLSSALAAPALAGIPLTYRGIAASLAIIAGHRQSLAELDWSVYRGVDTLVILMGVEHRDLIASALLAEGRPGSQPVAFIEHASTTREHVVEATLRDVARGKTKVEAPAVIVIGEVVRLRAGIKLTATSGSRAAD